MIRYEDVKRDFEGEMKRLFEFLDIAVSDEMLATMREVRSHRHAALFGLAPSNIKINRDEAEKMARGIVSCRRVIELFRF